MEAIIKILTRILKEETIEIQETRKIEKIIILI
jgi:hypothetical protein